MVPQTQPQAKAQWIVDPAHTSVEFATKHLVITTVRGRFTKFDVNVEFDEARPENSRVEVRIDAASIDTREPKRDAHLRSPDFLDIEKSPYITFKSRRIEPRGQNRYSVVGDLTIRDVTREVALDTTFAGIVKAPWGGYQAGFAAEATINRKDFGASWNVALEAGGFLVSDSVKIVVEAELTKKSG